MWQLRNVWLTGLLLVATLLTVIPYLTQARPAPPQPPAGAVVARIAPAPTLLPTPPPARPKPAPPAPTPVRPRGKLAAADAPYIPILMYHYIREVDERVDPLGFRLSIRPDRFAEQMAWLRANGYETLLMRELAACLRGERRCPSRAVALTFDDGYADQALAALPTLQRYGYRATFYVVTGLIGREGYMNWADLELLRDSGMEIGAHTVSHADLAAISPAEALTEILHSRAALERRLDIDVVSFSYPAGSYTPEVALAVWATGFHSAVTTSPSADQLQLYELPRQRVLGGEVIEGFPWYFRSPPAKDA